MKLIKKSGCPKCQTGDLLLKRKFWSGRRYVACTLRFACKYEMDASLFMKKTIEEKQFAQAQRDAVQTVLHAIRNPVVEKKVSKPNADKALKEIIFKYHPDRNKSGKLSASEVLSDLNRLRDLI